MFEFTQLTEEQKTKLVRYTEKILSDYFKKQQSSTMIFSVLINKSLRAIFQQERTLIKNSLQKISEKETQDLKDPELKLIAYFSIFSSDYILEHYQIIKPSKKTLLIILTIILTVLKPCTFYFLHKKCLLT